MGDLGQVGGEERELDGEEGHGAQGDQSLAGMPEQPGDREKENRVEHEGSGDRDAVSRGEGVRGSEPEDDRDHDDQEDCVDRRRIDLPDLVLGGVADG